MVTVDPGGSFLRELYFRLRWLLGDGKRLLARLRTNHYVVSLNLHRVSTDINPYYPPLPPKAFDELSEFVAQKFNVITYEQLTEPIGGKTPLVLSFDDGYHDFVEYAVPILKKRGLPANQNIVCDCVESGKPIWNVQLYDFLNQAPPKLLNELRVSGVDNSSQKSKSRLGLELSRALKTLSRRERVTRWMEIEAFMARCDDLQFTRVMNANEVRSVSKDYHIGAHSFAHDSMAQENADFFARDVLRCAEYFRDKLDLPLTTYAFPNGSYRPEQVQHLLASGFRHVLLVDEQFGIQGAAVQPRLTIYGFSRSELQLRSLGYFARGVRCES